MKVLKNSYNIFHNGLSEKTPLKLAVFFAFRPRIYHQMDSSVPNLSVEAWGVNIEIQ